MLLSDERFVSFAKSNVVLSWENVREPVKVKVDGKATTLGGNTVMYIVSPDGTVADAFPGVYTPEDVIASIKAAAKVAVQDQTARDKYHRQRTGDAIQARINLSKAFIEGPVLDATGAGDRFETATPAGVVDLSHIASSRDETRARLGIPQSLDEDRARKLAISMDSRANMKSLRPKVHEFLIGKAETPAQLCRVMFKDFLGVKIDDPSLGIR